MENKRYERFLNNSSHTDSAESSEDDSIHSNNEETDLKMVIYAAHVGSLTYLEATSLELNKDHIEIVFLKNMFLSKLVKLRIPWREIDEIETHFSSDVNTLIIHVEKLGAQLVINQLKDVISGMKPLTLDPESKSKYMRVLSFEFGEKPHERTLKLFEHYLKLKHNHKNPSSCPLKSCTSAHAMDFLPPDDSAVRRSETKVEDSKILLVYPETKPSVTVKYSDLESLKSGEFLNDVIIDFFLKFIQTELMPERTHVLKSSFYKTLTQPLERLVQTNHSPTWMSNSRKTHRNVQKFYDCSTDFFSEDYIIVPINDHDHWYLAIICYPWASWPQNSRRKILPVAEDKTVDDKNFEGVLTPRRVQGACISRESTPRPCILIYDSLVGSGRNKAISNIRNFLTEEWNWRNEKDKRYYSKYSFPGLYVDGPSQENFCDGGLFVLQFVEKFFESPIKNFRPPIERKNWFSQQDISEKRKHIHDLIMQWPSA